MVKKQPTFSVLQNGAVGHFWAEWPAFCLVSDLLPSGLGKVFAFIMSSPLFMSRWEHARSLPHSLTLLPGSGLVSESVERVRSPR